MILAIESSCDESALALFSPESGLIDEWVHTQIALHAVYGGIVPDLAGREHLAHLPELVRALFEKHGESLRGRLREIAVTVGPGLAGCLALGVASAQALGVALGVPVRGVNHLRGHAFSPFIALHAQDPRGFEARFQALLPHVGLLVSGGNTILFEIDARREVRILAQTLDDAAGEALDKGAKLLGMPYPGGPLVEKCALGGNPLAYDFPRAMNPRKAALTFSFSGLKTSLRYRLEKMGPAEIEREKPHLCAAYQAAVVDQLAQKTARALKERRPKSAGLSGGVSNNRVLRQRMQEICQKLKIPFFAAQKAHTGDNAGMIAFAAFADREGAKSTPAPVSFYPSLPLGGKPAGGALR